ncbi:MAG TPA: hypothetical protein VH144_01520 [Candidatus Saccharimonadales bacterium]|jgi:hypothetical protein|nr:hypothetical protein [Candidatus Saccharimonadales bacterium]
MTEITEVQFSLADEPTEQVKAFQERINQITSNDILDGMSFIRQNHIAFAIANPMDGPTYEDVLDGNTDETAVVRYLPWSNMADKKEHYNHAVQTQLIADLAGVPVITASSPARGSGYELNRHDRQLITSGDFDPVSREVLNALDIITHQKLSRIAFMGASYGGVLAINSGSLAIREDRMDVQKVLAIGLPTVKERSRRQLLSDFGQAGMGELHDTLMAGGIPQLIPANRMNLRERGKVTPYLVAEALATNLRHPVISFALAGGMGKIATTWQRDIPVLLEHAIPTTLVSEGQGAIMPRESAVARIDELEQSMASLPTAERERRFGNLILTNVIDGNHTVADHIPTVARLVTV